MKPKHRKLTVKLLALCVGSVIACLLAEGVFRVLEAIELRNTRHIGNAGFWMDDSHWGWKPTPGQFTNVTPEFTAVGSVNSNFMNDFPENPRLDSQKTRLLVLGDSHTFATGVSMTQTWAKRLEVLLNNDQAEPRYRTFNAGETGYSMHQYLFRLIDDGARLKPKYVLVGVSFATDFYDLLPPERGGWIYGGDRERDYFDFDAKGELVRKHWARQETSAGSVGANPANSIRHVLDHFATFRYLRRSKLALWIGARAKVRGQSLWPNMEIVMEKQVSPVHKYQHDLFRALLGRMKVESEKLGAKLIVVGIPYLPQVYDDLGSATFPGERFDCRATSRRVADYCREAGIDYVDTLDAFRTRYEQTHRWLHFRKDAHPTAEGHEVIASAIADSRAITR